jgi:hypothetical protein
MANIEEVAELSATTRGAGGFGSTGVSGSVPAQDENTNVNVKVAAASSDDSTAKRHKSSNVPSELLLFLHEVSSVLGADRVQSLKPLALSGDARLLAAHDEYRLTKSNSELLSTIDIVLAASQ